MPELSKAAHRRFIGSAAMPAPEPFRPLPRFMGALHSFDPKTGLWPSNHRATAVDPPPTQSSLPLRILTWNIEFHKPRPIQRLYTVLSHIQSLLSVSNTPHPGPPPTIILLQELLDTCFPTLLAHPFVRAHYALTDVSPHSWTDDAYYGTVTLVPLTLVPRVTSVFRTPLPNTRMHRDALYVDLDLDLNPTLLLPSSLTPDPNLDPMAPRRHRRPPPPPKLNLNLRIANVHLESLAGPSERTRARQLAAVALLLRDRDVAAGIVAGDMNAVCPGDRGLPEKVGLGDAWKLVKSGSGSGSRMKMGAGAGAGAVDKGKEKGGEMGWEDREEDHTWGYQPRCRFRPARLDKVLVVGRVRVEQVERVGVGLKIDVGAPRVDEEEEDEEEDDVEKDPWASDHYGLLATVVVGV